VDGQAVWAEFSGCKVDYGLSSQEKRKDVRALVTQLMRWLSVNPQHDYDPNLSPAINHLLERALSLPGFNKGQDLADAIEHTLQEICAPVVSFRTGWATHVGRERTLNEDSLLTLDFTYAQQFFSQSIGFYAVADGMGGHASGEVASGTIIHAISQEIVSGLAQLQSRLETDEERMEWLRQVIVAANQAVYEVRQATAIDMGSTLVMAMLFASRAYIAHVGDSRAYIVRDGGIRQITTDHSLVERLIATQMITREEARIHPQRNVVYRTMGSNTSVDIDSTMYELTHGDWLLLCSDGLSGMLEDDQIQHLVLQSGDPQAACAALIEAANQAGGKDNITVIAVEVYLPVIPDSGENC
jgi:protein phosphatase